MEELLISQHSPSWTFTSLLYVSKQKLFLPLLFSRPLIIPAHPRGGITHFGKNLILIIVNSNIKKMANYWMHHRSSPSVAMKQKCQNFAFFSFTTFLYLTTTTNNFLRSTRETGIDHNKPPLPQTPAIAGYGLHGNLPIEPIWIQFQK